MTSHEAELQSKLIKAREELRDLRARIRETLVGLSVTVEYEAHISCERAHYTADYHPDGHVETRTLIGRVVKVAEEGSEE